MTNLIIRTQKQESKQSSQYQSFLTALLQLVKKASTEMRVFDLPLINGKSVCDNKIPFSCGVAVPTKNVAILQIVTMVTQTIIPLKRMGNN